MFVVKAIVSLLALVLFIWTIVLASNKNRNLILWILLALFLTPFPFFVLVFSKEKKRCPVCQGRINIDAGICPKCRTDLISLINA